MISQIFIALFGVTAVALSQSTSAERRRWASVFGLVGQPFWFYAAWESQQWGIFALCCLYTLSWGKGFHTSWIAAKVPGDDKRESMAGEQVAEVAGRLIGYAAFGRADDGSLVALLDYAGATEMDVGAKVVARARGEGRKITSAERLAELEWSIFPLYAGPMEDERCRNGLRSAGRSLGRAA